MNSEIALDVLQLLSPYQQSFIKEEISRGLESYKTRLKFIGFENTGTILDAGGGIGQWAISLAELGNQVEVVDVLSERLFVGRQMMLEHDIKNVSFRYASIEKLPYPDNSFDGILCYSVFMFVDSHKALAEFVRVLKPGAKLYIMVDLWRWYLQLMLEGKMSIRSSAAAIVRKIQGRGSAFLTKRSFAKLLKEHGFVIEREGQEGQAYFGKTLKSVEQKLCFYPTDPEGKEKLWEVCALNGKTF